MSEKRSVKLKGEMDTKNVVSHLENVLAGLKKGIVHIEYGDRSVTLNPKDVLFFEMKAEDKKDKASISIEFGYKKEVVEEPAPDMNIKISSKEPAPKKVAVAAV